MKVRRMGEGAPILCLNGLTQTTANWTSAGRQLAERGHGVVLTDLPGQAGSEPLRSGTPKAQAGVVLELMDALGLDQVDVCGFSYGGRVALQMAALQPQRVRRLIMVSTSLGAGPVARLVVQGWLKALDRGGLEALGWDALPWIVGDGLLRGVDPQHMVTATVRRNSEAGIRSLIQGILDDQAPQLEGLNHPTLVLAGGRDRFILAQEQEAHAGRLPHGCFECLPELGHAVPVEDAAAFAEVVSRFVLT